MARAGIIYINDFDHELKSFLTPVYIRTDLFDEISYSFNGIISKFVFNGIAYIKQVGDVIGDGKGEEIKYISKHDYQRSIAGIIDKSEIRNFLQEDFLPGKKGDEAMVLLPELELSQNSSFCTQAYHWEIKSTEIDFIHEGTVELPDYSYYGSSNCNSLGKGQAFFDIHSLRLWNDQIDIDSPIQYVDIQNHIHTIIANISRVIDNIDSDIYADFLLENPVIDTTASFEDEVLSQILNFQEDIQAESINYNLNNLQDFRLFYKVLKQFQQNFLTDKLLIMGGTDMKKIANLCLSFHPRILVEIPIEQRIKLLRHILKEELQTNLEYAVGGSMKKIIGSGMIVNDPLGFAIHQEGNEEFYMNLLTDERLNNYEDLVLLLCLTFTQDHLTEHTPGFTHVDMFLFSLLELWGVGNNGITLYEAIYDRMSSPLLITEFFSDLANAISSNSQWQPSTTKDQYIDSLYNLWQVSKYNPYDRSFIPKLKPKSLGLRVLEGGHATVTNENAEDNQNCTFYYTHEVAYTSTQVEVEVNGNLKYYDKFWVKHNPASPMVIPFNSSKYAGMYWSDFTSEIHGDRIVIYENKVTGHVIDKKIIKQVVDDQEVEVEIEELRLTTRHIMYGVYNIMQPISLLDTSVETKGKFYAFEGEGVDFGDKTINSFIPAFVLHHIIHSGEVHSNEKMLGYLVDGALTFSGVGNLAKLAHLRWFALGAHGVGLFSKTGLRIVYGAIEFTTGVMSFLANFVECGDDEWCKKFKVWLSRFEMFCCAFSLGDTLISASLVKSSDQLIEAAGGGEDIVTAKNNIKSQLDQIPINPDSDYIPLDSHKEELAQAITDLGHSLYLNRVNRVTQAAQEITDEFYDLVYEDLKLRRWSLKHFRKEFTPENFKRVVQDCLEYGFEDVQTITDLIITACRGQKKYNFEDTRLMLNWYVNVTRKRGFPTGFMNLEDFKLFSIKARVYLDAFCTKWNIKGARYEIQGSSLYLGHADDPNLGDVAEVVKKNGAIRFPDDADGRMVLNHEAFNKFLSDLEDFHRTNIKNEFPNIDIDDIKDELETRMSDVYRSAKNGIIHKHAIPPFGKGPDGYRAMFREAALNHEGRSLFYITGKAGYSDVGFAIVREASDFDLEPSIKLIEL